MTTTDEDRELADICIEQFASLQRTLASLTDGQWDLPSGLPGWTVRDVVSHVIGFERQFFMREQPDVAPLEPRPAHVHNDIAAENERWVQMWKHDSPTLMMDRYDQMVRRRKAQIVDALVSPAGFDTLVRGLRGDVPYRDSLPIRIADITTHEIDVRRACSCEWNADAPGVNLLRSQMIAALPRIASKQAGLPNGTVVALSLFGTHSLTSTVLVEEARARAVLAGEHQPVAALTMHDETFLAVTTGRTDAAAAVEAGRIKLRGDEDLARQFACALRVITF